MCTFGVTTFYFGIFFLLLHQLNSVYRQMHEPLQRHREIKQTVHILLYWSTKIMHNAPVYSMSKFYHIFLNIDLFRL